MPQLKPNLYSFGWVIREMFQRIIHLIHKSTAAITHGDFSQHIPLIGNGDERDDVAIAINAMLDGASQQMDNVRQTSNAIAHDLRAPIARARSQLEDAALYAHTEAELRTAINHAVEQLDHVTSICNALLRIAQIEAGGRRSAFTRFDLVPALQDILELYAAVAEDRGITIETTLPQHFHFMVIAPCSSRLLPMCWTTPLNFLRQEAPLPALLDLCRLSLIQKMMAL